MEFRKPVDSPPPSTSSSSMYLDCSCGKKSSSSCRSSAGAISSSTMGIFNSLFPPASTILQRNSLHSVALGSLGKQYSENQVWNAKHESADGADQSSHTKSQTIPDRDVSSVYPNEAEDPFPLSSSLYYGGRDFFIHFSNVQDPVTPKTHHQYEENSVEDDLNSLNIASRGNWWQGSLYY